MASQRKPFSLRNECGQSLLVVVLSMGVIIGIAALAIDVSSWYQHHHQAQVVADSAALAAANCLADPNSGPTPQCTSSADTSDAQNLAVAYAGANGLTINRNNVVFNPNSTVTVTAAVNAPAFFATIFGISSSAQTANATASWAGQSIPYSLFAENTTCDANTGIQAVGTGGGTNSIFGLHSNGEYFNNNNSGSIHFFGTLAYTSSGTPVCGAGDQSNVNQQCSSTSNCWKSNGTTTVNSSGISPVLYPSCYPEPGTTTPTTITSLCATSPTAVNPTCTYPAPPAADYWTTSTSAPAANQITGPGVYCVGSSTNGPLQTFPGTSCSSTSGATGSIYVSSTNSSGTSSLTGSSGYEFVGPCVTLSSASSGTLSGPPGGPLVYGTANTTSTGTPDTWIIGNGATLQSPVFDPLGTVDFKNNNDFVGFVEAQNIDLEKNNGSSSTVSGNGPDGANQPGQDLLTG